MLVVAAGLVMIASSAAHSLVTRGVLLSAAALVPGR
jgi:hypothetical protein